MVQTPYQEEWIPIEELQGYFISNWGNVKRQSREFQNKMISIKGSVNNRGYKYIQRKFDNKRKNFAIHRLVAKAFLENPENKPNVDHIDNNPLNNHFTNLRWCNHNENMKNIKQRTEGKKNGVIFDKKNQRWMACAHSNNKHKFLGYFDSYDEARQARESFENNQEEKEFYKTGNDESFSDLKSRPKSKRGQGEGCIYQQKNGRWRTTLISKGIIIFAKTFKTFEEAQAFRDDELLKYKK